MAKNFLKDIREINTLLLERIKKDNIFKSNLNHTQIQILVYLIRHSNEEVCQKDLEIETNLKKASITGTLDSLESKGIIERIQSKDDKRKNIIVLSQTTIEAKDRIASDIRQLDASIKAGISDEEFNTFVNVIEKIKNNLE